MPFDSEFIAENGLTEKVGFVVQDWSTSPTFWKFEIREATYYVDRDEKIIPQSRKTEFGELSEIDFDNLEETYFPDVETATSASQQVADKNKVSCSITPM